MLDDPSVGGREEDNARESGCDGLVCRGLYTPGIQLPIVLVISDRLRKLRYIAKPVSSQNWRETTAGACSYRGVLTLLISPAYCLDITPKKKRSLCSFR